MPIQMLNSRAARQQWRDLLDYAHQGGRTVITRDEKPIAAVIGLADLQQLEEPMPQSDPTLDDLRAQGAGPQAIYQVLLRVHHGDAQAAARALLAHIQAEQQALALLLAKGGNPA